MLAHFKRLPSHVRAMLFRVLRLAGIVLFGGLTMGIIVLVITLNNRPDLKIWHEADLDQEFTRKTKLKSFDEYLELEDRLFAQLKKKVYDEIEEVDKRKIVRFAAGSLSDASAWSTDWNRTQIRIPQNPTSGILMLHGMSDSPYSMRTFAERLDDGETAIIALRIPGHGTAPCGLLDVRWEDMGAAVDLAMRHLKKKVGDDGPIAMIGYSNGGALAIEYALSAIEDSSMPRLDRIVLLSPSIGVTKLAGLAIWQSRLGRVLGLKKLAWNSISPEYDPYKYGSFALNAARQSHRLTTTIQKRLKKAKKNDTLGNFPPVLAFQSVVDATVSAPALVEVLFDSLPENGHELVLYDINRLTEAEPVFNSGATAGLENIKTDLGHTFTVTILENRNGDSREIVRSTRPPKGKLVEHETDLSWPDEIYSLSHVALPFAETDPIYGGDAAEEKPEMIQIGNTIVRGERSVLQIPASTMLRLRWNPFFDYQMEQINSFLRNSDPQE